MFMFERSAPGGASVYSWTFPGHAVKLLTLPISGTGATTSCQITSNFAGTDAGRQST